MLKGSRLAAWRDESGSSFSMYLVESLLKKSVGSCVEKMFEG